MTPPTTRFDLFIAAQEEDTAWVEGFLLREVGVSRERVATLADLPVGSAHLTALEEAVVASRYTVLLSRPVVKGEDGPPDLLGLVDLLAFQQGQRSGAGQLIVVERAQGPLALRLEILVRLNCSGEDPEVWRQEIGRLRALLGTEPMPQEQLAAPYPGMVPFDEKDAPYFFGRKRVIEALQDRLEHQGLVLLIGPSGSGKSSLLQAGLLANLEDRKPEIRALTLRPGAAPLAALEMMLGGAFGSEQIAAVRGTTSVLWLVVDPLEEVFSQATPEAQDVFFKALRALAQMPGCRVLAALRADFYQDLMNSTLWPVGPEERVDLGPLGVEELLLAIVKPAERCGVRVEPMLAERLVQQSDTRQPGMLPVLQETMRRLWDRRVQRLLTLAAYKELGGDGKSGFAASLALVADAALGELRSRDARCEAITRRIFLRLVQFGEGRPDTRRQQSERALRIEGEEGGAFDATLALLTERRLLTCTGGQQEGQGRLVDLAHEALLDGWPALAGWRRDKAQAEQARRRWENKVKEWERRGRERYGLLDAGEVPKVQEWLVSADASDVGAPDGLVALLRGSMREQQRQQRQWRGVALVLALLLLGMAVAGWEASARRTEALVQLAANHTEQGRQLLLSGRPGQALAYLNQAYRETGIGAHSVLRFLLARAASQATTQRIVLRGHSGPVSSAVFSADGDRVVTASNDCTARIWDARSGRVATVLDGHTRAITSAVFDPDGGRVVTASVDHTARIWDSRGGKVLVILAGHVGPLWSATFSTDGSRVVTASEDGTARLWDARSGHAVRVLRGHGSAVTSAVFSPNGNRIVTVADHDNTARVWDAKSGQALAMLKCPGEKMVSSAVFSPDGGRVVTACWDGSALVWDVQSGDLAGTPGPPSRRIAWDAQFSPDGTLIVTADGDKIATVRDARTGYLIARLEGHESDVRAAMFSPDGSQVVTASDDKTARVWDVRSGQVLAVLWGHEAHVSSARFSLDGSWVVTASKDGTARVWSVRSGRVLAMPEGHQATVNSGVFSPDGNRVVTASNDRTARIWDARSGQMLALLRGHKEPVNFAMFSPDGSCVVTASNDATARVWDVHSGQVLAQLVGHANPVIRAAFSPDGSHVVTASLDGTARVWDRRSGTTLAVLDGHKGGCDSATFSPDGGRVLTATKGMARVWDVHSGKVLARLPRVGEAVFSPEGDRVFATGAGTGWVFNAWNGRVLAVLKTDGGLCGSPAFSPDGNRVVMIYGGEAAGIWDARIGKMLATIDGQRETDRQRETFWSAAFSPDGSRVVTTSIGNTVRIWDALNGKLLANLAGHNETVWFAAFSPDGSRVVTASDDRTARIWDAHLELRSPLEMSLLVGCRNSFRFEEERLVPTTSNPLSCLILER